MDGKKISQIGATNEGVAFLRKLAGRSEESGAKRDEEIAPTAPFKEMKDAYRVLFIYGLIKGERLPTKSGQSFSTIYANVNMLTDSFDYHTLLQTLEIKKIWTILVKLSMSTLIGLSKKLETIIRLIHLISIRNLKRIQMMMTTMKMNYPIGSKRQCLLPEDDF